LAEEIEALRQMVDRFIEVDCLDTNFVDTGLLDRLPRPGRVGGIDINRPRACAMMQTLLALSPNAAGFTSAEFATKVVRLLKDERCSPNRAAYTLRKYRCKGLAARIPCSRRYLVDPSARRAIASLLRDGSSRHSSRRHPRPAAPQSPVSSASWTNATPVFITRCEASSTPLGSPFEPHPQRSHDG